MTNPSIKHQRDNEPIMAEILATLIDDLSRELVELDTLSRCKFGQIQSELDDVRSITIQALEQIKELCEALPDKPPKSMKP